MPGGRPTKYKKKYCKELIDHMAKGLSFRTFAAKIEVHHDTLYEWAEVYEEFSDAKSQAFNKCRLFWENLSIDQSTGKNQKGNVTATIFNMKARFKEFHENTTDAPKIEIIVDSKKDGK